jgi:futalosine hydrolase
MRGEMRVLVVAALKDEAKAVVGLAEKVSAYGVGPYRGLRGRQGGIEYSVLVSGIGPLAAAAAASAALAAGERFDLILSAGIAGGFGESGVIPGQFVIADEIIFADASSPPSAEFVGIDEAEWPPRAFPTTEGFTSAVVDWTAARHGSILTVSAMTVSDERRLGLVEQYPSAIAEAMEGAGVASVAWRWDKPCAELRSISNLIGTFDESNWVIEDALHSLEEGFAAISRGLQSYPIDRL